MSNLNKGYRGLGRGLESLLSSPRANASNLSSVEGSLDVSNELPISSLRSGRFQPRTTFNEEQLNSLANSIKTQGIVQPIVVRQLDDGSKDNYEIIAGERRWRAAKKAGLSNVPVIIRNDLDDQHAMAIALIENIQREDLNVIEEAEGLKRLNAEFGLTHEEVARIVGRSRSAITNSLRLLDLNPDVQNMVREDKLKMGHVRALLPLDFDQQLLLAEQVYDKKLTAREVEKLVSNMNRGERDVTKSVEESEQNKELIMQLQHQLIEILNKPVKISYKANGQGSINIGFLRIDEVQSLIETFTQKKQQFNN